jgi:DNA-binding transcriptional LysR family regulator
MEINHRVPFGHRWPPIRSAGIHAEVIAGDSPGPAPAAHHPFMGKGRTGTAVEAPWRRLPHGYA